MIPPKANAAFVAAMEDVLDVYTRPRDPARPLVCLDETLKQLVAETRQPEPLQPGRPARHDYEYKRNGTANLFMLFAPLEGWRHVEVTERRTAIDYAKILRDLSDIHFPNAEKIVLVQDSLNTHAPSSLYEAFEPTEARRIMAVLPKRFARFGLTIPPQTTAVIAVGKPSARAEKKQGKSTFDFLGFTHYWARSRQGYWVIKRRTAKKRLRRTLTALWQWCRSHRHRKVEEQHQELCQKLRGHYQYSGIRGNDRL